MFKWDINLGNVLTLGAMILTMFKLHTDNVKRLTEIEVKVNTLWRLFMHGKIGNGDENV